MLKLLIRYLGKGVVVFILSLGSLKEDHRLMCKMTTSYSDAPSNSICHPALGMQTWFHKPKAFTVLSPAPLTRLSPSLLALHR